MSEGESRTDSAAEGARVRLDRWLWAARFFKTRAQAKAAIEGGKVSFHGPGDAQGYKPKASKEVAVGDRLSVRRGVVDQTVDVTGLAERRGSAGEAARLYEETDASIEAREAALARRRMERAGLRIPAGRPDKRGRRELARLKQRSETGEGGS